MKFLNFLARGILMGISHVCDKRHSIHHRTFSGTVFLLIAIVIGSLPVQFELLHVLCEVVKAFTEGVGVVPFIDAALEHF